MITLDPVLINRYANALFNIAKREGVTTLIHEQLVLMSKLYTNRSQLGLFLESPHITTDDKLARVVTPLKQFLHPIILSLLEMLLRKGRIEYAGAILRRVDTLIEEDSGVFPASVTTARELSDEEKTTLQASLEKFSSAKLRIRYTVKPELIGGIMFRKGDLLIDDTVRGKLDKVAGRLKAVMYR